MAHHADLPTAVVYDIGRVLIEWDVHALYRTIIPDDTERHWFLDEVWRPEDNARCDMGEPFAAVVAERAAEHPEWATALSAIEHRWIETIPGPVAGAFEVVRELHHGGVALHGLSNFSAETFPLIQHRYPVFDLLDPIVISGDHPGLLKPDPRFFELLCELVGRTPEEMLFVDDSLPNVEGAARLGFRTHHFTDTPTWRAELVRIGLLR